jgi:hypothetical protein
MVEPGKLSWRPALDNKHARRHQRRRVAMLMECIAPVDDPLCSQAS